MTIDDYRREIKRLENETRELREKLNNCEDELYSANFRIRSELEPRLADERRAYDRNLSERGKGND